MNQKARRRDTPSMKKGLILDKEELNYGLNCYFFLALDFPFFLAAFGAAFLALAFFAIILLLF